MWSEYKIHMMLQFTLTSWVRFVSARMKKKWNQHEKDACDKLHKCEIEIETMKQRGFSQGIQVHLGLVCMEAFIHFVGYIVCP